MSARRSDSSAEGGLFSFERQMNERIKMAKQVVVLVILSMGLVRSPSSLQATQSAQGARCLHGSSEQPNERIRREQALRMAEQINRAEGFGVGSPRNRRYLPFDRLTDVPATPAGFRLQFHTDGPTYTFSLKDTTDLCHYAIFSDQDQGIYQATTTTGVRIVPAGTR